jgi:hypothetical protein
VKARRLAASSVVAACALHFSFTPQAQSPPSSLRQLAQDLASRIAAVVAPLEEVRLAGVDPDSRNAAADRLVQPEIAALLRARGLSLILTPSDRAASVRIACSENLRDSVCAAEIVKGDIREIVVASGQRGGTVPDVSRVVALDVQPILSQAERILDLVEIGDRLLVLNTAGFQMYQRSETGWKAGTAYRTTWETASSRDPRGRLSVNGTSVDAFLPGMVCHCTLEPFQANCAQSPDAPWPVGVPNSSLSPHANYFTSPKTPAFFTAAPLGGDTVSGWLLAGIDGKLHILGDTFAARQTLPGLGDDIASVKTGCGPDRQIIVALSNLDGNEADSLQAYEMAGSQLVAVTPPVAMAGRVTALWEVPGKPRVLVVAQNRDSGRHEAFYVGLACAR